MKEVKTTRHIRINPAENGWIAMELIHTESVCGPDEDDEYDAPSYDDGHEEHHHCHHEEKTHVFSDHAKLMAWVSERTKNFSSES